MKYIIDESLANSILDYLVRRPYMDVANLVQALHLMKPLEVDPKVADPNTKETAVSPKESSQKK